MAGYQDKYLHLIPNFTRVVFVLTDFAVLEPEILTEKMDLNTYKPLLEIGVARCLLFQSLTSLVKMPLMLPFVPTGHTFLTMLIFQI